PPPPARPATDGSTRLPPAGRDRTPVPATDRRPPTPPAAAPAPLLLLGQTPTPAVAGTLPGRTAPPGLPAIGLRTSTLLPFLYSPPGTRSEAGSLGESLTDREPLSRACDPCQRQVVSAIILWCRSRVPARGIRHGGKGSCESF